MDTRRVGHAQRRRVGAPSNVYADVMEPPRFGAGEAVRAKGRYRDQMIEEVLPNIARPDADNDGHGYVVSGGKMGRKSVHTSSELRGS